MNTIRKYINRYGIKKILLEMIRNPSKLLNVLIYENSKIKVINNVLPGCNRSEIKELFQEFEEDNEIEDRLSKCFRYLENNNYSVGGITEESEIIYCISRHLSPDNIVEVGVANGFSTFTLLKSIQKNGTGELYSIDRPVIEGESGWEDALTTVIPEHRRPGWVAPEKVRNNWSYIEGEVDDKLDSVLDEISCVQLLVYDADMDFFVKTFDKVHQASNNSFITIVDDAKDGDNEKILNELTEKYPHLNKTYFKKVAIIH